jgi:hypothetical protein
VALNYAKYEDEELLFVEGARQSDEGTSECASHHTSIDTETPTVAKARSLLLADIA